MRTTALVLVVCFLGACRSAPTRPAPTQAEQNAARERYAAAYADALSAADRYAKVPEAENTDSREVEARLADLEKELVLFNRVSGSTLRSAETETRSRHTKLAFALADAALAKGALDVADRTYRRLVEFYVGNAYSGIRDRARMGVDDVRSRRAAASPAK